MPGKSKAHKDKKDRSSRKASPHSSGRGNRNSSSKGSASKKNAQKQVWSGSAKSKKSSCLPKLFMLTLPFLIIGTYMFLGY